MEGKITLCIFFLVLRFEIWKITTIPTWHRHLLFQTRSVLRLSLAYSSTSFLLCNSTVLANSYYCFVPLHQSLQTRVLMQAHSLQAPRRRGAEGCWHHAPHRSVRRFAIGHTWPSTSSYTARRCASQRFADPAVRAFLQQVPHANNWSWSAIYALLCTRLLLLRNIYHPKTKILP